MKKIVKKFTSPDELSVKEVLTHFIKLLYKKGLDFLDNINVMLITDPVTIFFFGRKRDRKGKRTRERESVLI